MTTKPATDFQVRRFSDLKPDYADHESISAFEVLGRDTGARIGSGYTFWRDIEKYTYNVWYDEIITCFSISEGGSVEMDINEEGFQKLEVGDMVWLADGTRLTYRIKGEVVLHYSVTPTDWADRTEGQLRPDEA